MSDIIKVGSFDVTSIRVGSTPVDKVMVGTVKVYPQETPVTTYKWLSTYSDSHTESAECDSTSAITQNEITKTDLVSVEIGNCVTSIGDSAFNAYNKLSSVTIPSSVTSIGASAFKGCSFLNSVTIPDSVTSIGASGFSQCGRLTSVNIPSSLTSISDGAFRNCGLTSVTIPNSVTSIGASAFTNCSSLSSVTIPSSVTSISASAFAGCTRLSSVTIPNGVVSIGDYAFSACSSYRFTSVTIPNSVTTLGYGSFKSCSELKTVTIGSGVTSIGGEAFGSCYQLNSITVNAVTPPALGANAFYSTNDCPIYVPCASVDAYKSAWSTYADRIRCNQTNMQITYLAASKANVNLNGFTPAATAETFSNGLGRVEFAADVTSVGSGFSGKTGVTSIFLPNSVTSIGTSAFTQCKSLSSCTIPSGVTSIGNQAFHTCSAMTTIDIPSGVTSIGENAFFYCTSLTSVIIPNSVTSISRGVFYMCSSLTDIVIPSGVTSIGINSFGYCSSLTSITISSGVTSIGNGAFSNCTSLTAITCEATTPPTLGNYVFDDTNNCPINVPCASVSAYKTATNWSSYESRIQCEGPVDYKTKYFTVILDEAGTITYSSTTAASQVVYYSTDDGTNWTALQTRTSTPTISGGKKVLFKASGLAVNSTSGIGKFSATTNFSVEGNPMSLVSGDSFANADTIPNNNQFRRLFERVNTLTNAENLVLPATTLTNGCYYQMFGSCSKLITGPRKMEIPSVMPQSGCTNMFSGCTSMTECLMDVGSLSSTTINLACYYNMFRNCKSLTALTSNQNQIVLPAATLTNQCYYGMFVGCSGITQSVYIGCSSIPSGSSGLTQMMSGCTNITEIYCAATGISSSNLCGGSYSPTYMWVKDVASASSSANCKFHAHVGEQWSTDVTCMSQYCASYPSGWTYLADITT